MQSLFKLIAGHDNDSIGIVLCGTIDPDCRGQIALLPHSGDNKEVCLEIRISFGCLLILLFSVININKKL